MREIDVKIIEDKIAELCVKANCVLPKSLENTIYSCAECETGSVAKGVFEDMKENIRVATELDIPICQDTGMAVVFIEAGQDVHFTGGSLEEAINKGVSRGYKDGYLRCSVVGDPLERINTGDNTPAIIHTKITPGDRVKITVAPKGFGSENTSAIKMLTPSATEDDIVAFVTETVKKAGSRCCPPSVVGVGIGGDFEYCAILSKKALCRDTDIRNANPLYAALEKKCLDSVNALGIGPQGFGGSTTALCVNIEQFPTHIAGLPVAVNIGCHVTRHCEEIV